MPFWIPFQSFAFIRVIRGEQLLALAAVGGQLSCGLVVGNLVVLSAARRGIMADAIIV